jgi:thiosulfate/3-mercaptopyruvate sulfurtransferase
MINTFFESGTLSSPSAFFASLLIGIAFGVALEQAGFGSSRRLAGIFYFRDMAVFKVMFTGVIVAMLGICYAKAFGWVTQENVYFLPTVYAAQIIGGLVFGIGFVMSGWCPGTAAVGLASGKIDALVFLLSAAGGSMLYNELYPLVSSLGAADRGVVFAYDSLGMSEAGFAFLLTLIAIAGFWGCELLEKKRVAKGELLGSLFLKAFSVILLIASFGLFAVAGPAPSTAPENELLAGLQQGADHIEPQELADRLLAGDASIRLIDIRTPGEFAQFHIRTAINMQPEELPAALAAEKNRGLIVLYSNGMTHPAQARDSLFRLGFGNVYFLTDGLDGFLSECLKPVSLRAEPVTPLTAAKVTAWRAFFLATDEAAEIPAEPAILPETPGQVETDWLNTHLGKTGIRIIDLRSQPDYNGGHIPGAVRLDPESLRGWVNGVPSSLLPANMLAEHFSLMGIEPDDLVVLVCTDKLQDATLPALACERLGHKRFALLRGGFPKWQTEQRPLDTVLPAIPPSAYPVPKQADHFTVGATVVMRAIGKPGTLILDARPADYFSGKKQDEARGGHILGAINRPYPDDVVKIDAYTVLKPLEELRAAYAALIPSTDTPVILYCRTGHQASQTYFVLVHLLGYTNVKWYDGGWTEWAAHPEWPLQKD